MSTRLIDLLLRLAPRERLLLGLLVFAVLPLAVVFGLLLPLHERRIGADRSEAEALALQDWVAARIAEIPAEAGVAPETGPPIGSGGIEQSLIKAGLRGAVSALATRAGDEVELSFEEVPFVPLAGWLSRMDPGWGYRIGSLRLEALERPGLVAARLTLSPRG